MKYPILVTGADGYIGTNLVRMLQNKGKDVLLWDKKLGKDIEHPIENKEIGAIVHLAAISGIQDCAKYPHVAIHENIINSLNVIHKAAELDIPLIFASSQAAKTPNSSVYAMTKATIEQAVLKYHDKSVIFRLANVYGGHEYLERKNSVVAEFARAYLENRPLEVHGDGSQKRDFIHVEDVCDMIFRFLDCKGIPEVLELGTGRGTSILRLAEMFDHEIKMVEGPSTGVKSSIADVGRLRYILMMNNPIKFRLKEYIEEIKSMK